eukprot:GHRQ01036992.1.p1 GENE.GHRQ01036992.1~~GHRQ01036992.1.p1  ORF type:complete len:131 (-),score=20.72 GHRQ01036992.1:223-615(-)
MAIAQLLPSALSQASRLMPQVTAGTSRCSHAAPLLAGTIINIGSIAGYVSQPFWAAYSASKSALMSATDAMRPELKPCGVKVVYCAPGEQRCLTAFPLLAAAAEILTSATTLSPTAVAVVCIPVPPWPSS